MKNWIGRIFKINDPNPAEPDASNSLGVPDSPPSKVDIMIRMLGNTQGQESSCDEVHKLLGQFAEMALRGEDIASLMPLVHHHLELCPDCREEYNAVLDILKALPE